MTTPLKTSKDALYEILQTAVAEDEALRQKFNMGDKFRFIREQLLALQASVGAELALIKDEINHSAPVALAEDELIVYVYLFNAQGVLVPTWRKMVQSSVLYEYSVNRPIYTDESAIQAVIRTKSNKQQHAYLAVAVKKENIYPMADAALKDAMGNTLIKVKEGSLHFNRILFFKHNESEYRVNDLGELIKV